VISATVDVVSGTANLVVSATAAVVSGTDNVVVVSATSENNENNETISHIVVR
jgi:hypothetical protein